MAYKVFQNGFPLNASELNNYLMNQSVMVFASTTARDADLTAPLEGMIVWLQDSNKFVYYTGTAWADVDSTYESGNAIINGAFDINQRQFTSVTTNGTFTFDRWKQVNGGGTVTSTPQTFTPGSAPISGYEATNFLRTVVSGQSGASDYAAHGQNIENVRTFAGQTVTLSFFAKAASGTPKVSIEFVQAFGTGGSADVNTAANAATTISTSWARYSVTVAIPSIAGKTIGTGSFLTAYIWESAGTTFNSRANSIGVQNNTFDIWGIQVESGSVATPFKLNAPNIGLEELTCKRYYQRFLSVIGMGVYYASNQVEVALQFEIPMRVAPSISVASGTNYYSIRKTGGDDSFNSFTALFGINKTVMLYNNTEVSGTAGYAGVIATASGSALIEASSEL